MERIILEKILGRKIHEDLLQPTTIADTSFIITGANGSIGKRLTERLQTNGNIIMATDIDELDVTDINSVAAHEAFEPDYIINCAGAKHAPIGEDETIETLLINTIGTENLLRTFLKAKHILTSTCKSCNPETVYGASKLIAERLVLNAGGSVARFYNVIETSGNIFELWEQQQEKKVVERCNRYFITIDEAVGLILKTIQSPAGRYSVKTTLRNMKDIYFGIYGENSYISMDPRRGDRITELLHSTSEWIESETESTIKIKSWHDDHRTI